MIDLKIKDGTPHCESCCNFKPFKESERGECALGFMEVQNFRPGSHFPEVVLHGVNKKFGCIMHNAGSSDSTPTFFEYVEVPREEVEAQIRERVRARGEKDARERVMWLTGK